MFTTLLMAVLMTTGKPDAVTTAYLAERHAREVSALIQRIPFTVPVPLPTTKEHD